MRAAEVPFPEAFKDVSAGNRKIPQSELLASGSLAVVDQGQALVAGFTDLPDAAVRTDGPLIVFGDHTRAVKYVDFPFAMGADGVKVLQVCDGFDPKFAYHYLRSREIPSAGYSRHFKFLKEISVPKPPLPKQRRIAAILDHADVIRAKRRQVLAHFDSLTQSIFHDMFGDPVTNPRAWPTSLLDEQVVSMQYGPRFHNESYTADGTRIVRITDLDPSGHLNFDAMPRLEVSPSDEEKYALSDGDVLFARTGATVGKLALVTGDAPRCIAGAYFIRLRFKPEVVPEYAYAALRTSSIQSIVWAGSQQSAQQNFSGPGLRALPLPVPPISLQREFAERVERVNTQRAITTRAVSVDDELFSSLHSRAFKGEL